MIFDRYDPKLGTDPKGDSGAFMCPDDDGSYVLFGDIKPLLEVRDENARLKAQIAELEAGMSEEDIQYPRDIFNELIEKSPYAFYLFQWVPYQTEARRWRLKMSHDVKHKDGRIECGIWPNGTHCGSFFDDDVEFIRISKKQLGREYIDPRDKD